MLIADAFDSFHRYAALRGADLTTLGAERAAKLMLGWFESEPATDISVQYGQDSDSLLLQWGTYESADGPWFHYDLTRQFCFDEPGEQCIWQLSVTLLYTPTAATRALGSATHWCPGHHGLPEFRTHLDSPAATYARTHSPTRTQVTFQDAC